VKVLDDEMWVGAPAERMRYIIRVEMASSSVVSDLVISFYWRTQTERCAVGCLSNDCGCPHDRRFEDL
jgi:hypothetical protein